MRALTLTQPWCGLVASGIKLVENRPRRMIKSDDFGKPFALHASREIHGDVYASIESIAPELYSDVGPPESPLWERPWYRLSRVTSAVIALATIDKVFDGGWTEESIAAHADDLSFASGARLGPDQIRWFFGPVGYVLRDIRALATPVPCRGNRGFWTLSAEIERAVVEQIGAAP